MAQGRPSTSEALDLHLQSVGHQSGLNRRQSGLNWCPSGGTCVARGKKKFGYQGTLLKVAPEGNKTSPPHRCTVSTRGVTFVPACTLGLTSSRAAGGRTAIRTTAKDEHCKPMNSISWRTGNLRQSYAICGADRCWPSGWLAGWLPGEVWYDPPPWAGVIYSEWRVFKIAILRRSGVKVGRSKVQNRNLDLQW